MVQDQILAFYNSLVTLVSSSKSAPAPLPPTTPVAPVVLHSATVGSWSSWSVACTYLVLLLVLNNLTPLMGCHRLLASLIQYTMQGVPLVMGLTGLGPCAAFNQLLLYLFSCNIPDTGLGPCAALNQLFFYLLS